MASWTCGREKACVFCEMQAPHQSDPVNSSMTPFFWAAACCMASAGLVLHVSEATAAPAMSAATIGNANVFMMLKERYMGGSGE